MYLLISYLLGLSGLNFVKISTSIGAESLFSVDAFNSVRSFVCKISEFADPLRRVIDDDRWCGNGVRDGDNKAKI